MKTSNITNRSFAEILIFAASKPNAVSNQVQLTFEE
jgi:hypothetical protein